MIKESQYVQKESVRGERKQKRKFKLELLCHFRLEPGAASSNALGGLRSVGGVYAPLCGTIQTPFLQKLLQNVAKLYILLLF